MRINKWCNFIIILFFVVLASSVISCFNISVPEKKATVKEGVPEESTQTPPASEEPKEKPFISSFSSSPEVINTGDSSTLKWNTVNAASVVIDQGIGTVALTGSRVVFPATTTVYTLTAENTAGSVTASAQVIVTPVSPPPPPPPSPPPAAGLPDLIIEDVMRSGSTISYKIKNQGDADAGATISVLVVDGSVKANDPVNPLAAGATSTESFSYSYGCSDTSDTVVVRADKNDVVTESNEGNNERSESWSCIKLSIPGPTLKLKPDLIITDIWKVSEITGDKIYYKIKNIGLGSAAASTTAFHPDPNLWPGQKWATDNVDPIAPGVEVTRKFAAYNYTGAGNKVIVTADDGGVVAEADEGNNSRQEPTSGL